MILPALLYIIWDAIFTAKDVWSFNENYISGIKYWGLPLEEILFFFVVPYCCVFIYECIRCYFPGIKDNLFSVNFLKILAGVLFILSFIFTGKDYTVYTFRFLAVALILFVLLRAYFPEFNITAFLVSYAIILIPFLIVNGFLTAIPVVLYNNTENLDIRIYTIPVEDVFYGMLLIFLNVLLFEKLQKASKTHKQ